MKYSVIIVIIILMAGCSQKKLSMQEKFLCNKIKAEQTDTMAVVLMYPDFCGACTEESMQIIDHIRIYYKPVIITTDNMYADKYPDAIFIEQSELNRNGIIHTNNQLYRIHHCHILTKTPITRDGKAEILNLLNLPPMEEHMVEQ